MENDHKPLTYNESGVDIEAGEAFVEDIAEYAKKQPIESDRWED